MTGGKAFHASSKPLTRGCGWPSPSPLGSLGLLLAGAEQPLVVEGEGEGGQDQQRAVDGEAPGLQLPLRQPGLTGAPALRAKSCCLRARSRRTARRGRPNRASVRITCSSEPVKDCDFQ